MLPDQRICLWKSSKSTLKLKKSTPFGVNNVTLQSSMLKVWQSIRLMVMKMTSPTIRRRRREENLIQICQFPL